MIQHSAYGFFDIKNGYADELYQWEHQIKGLKQAINSQKTTPSQKSSLLKVLRYSQKYGQQLQHDYHLTEQTIVRFQKVDPELYDSVSNVRDHQGNLTHVYVKVIAGFGETNGQYGTTNLNQNPANKHEYISCYGEHSVMVKVAAGPRALILLAHEFGHVLYQVPNLASYTEYYHQHYTDDDDPNRGHLPQDPSNLTVHRVLKRFKGKLSRKRRLSGG